MIQKDSGTIRVDDICDALLSWNNLALFILDSEQRFVSISPAIKKITGRSAEELSGKPFSSIVFSGNDSPAQGPFADRTGLPVKRDLLIVNEDSTVLHGTVTAICSNIGNDEYTIGVIGMTQTADFDVESKVRTFTMAVEQSPATVVITDKNGSIEYVNPKFTHLTGYTFNEALGHNPRILKSGKQSLEFYRDLWQTITAGKEWRGEFHNKKKNGDLYWESASISPILDDEGRITHFVAVKEDITDRKKAEEELRIAGEILQKKNDDMARELRHAQLVTGLLLPGSPPRHERIQTDFRFKPLDAIGGDFFSFNTLHKRGLGVFIGDVAGHGVSAALFLTLLKSLTDRLNAARGDSPSLFIQELNENLAEGNILYFITALYGFFDCTTDRVTFSFAKGGHTPPVLFRAADSSASLLMTGGMPVGLSRSAKFEELHSGLNPGDRLYLYTDGLNEIRNEAGTMLEPEGIRDIVARSGSMKLGESLDFILDEATRFGGSMPVEDDIVLIGFEVHQ